MTTKFAITAGVFCLCATGATSSALAQSLTQPTLPTQPFTLANGSVVNVTQSVLGIGTTTVQNAAGTVGSTPITPGIGATGVVSGTLTQAGTSTAFSCGYDVVSGQISGGGSCGQILGGSVTGGLSVSALERDVVAARIEISSANQASANVRLLDDLATRRLGINTAVAVQAELQASGQVDASNVFGEPRYGAWSSAGADFFNDERFGMEREGDNKVFTVGVDHTVENWMVGIYGGYLDTKVDLISLDGDLESDGWLAGTYVTRVLDDVFSITGAASYADSQTHLSRDSAGTFVNAAFDHMEWSATLNGNAFWLVAPQFGLTGTAGVSYDKWRDDAYSDSLGNAFTKTSGRNVWGRVGGTATFFAGVVRPYATLTYGRLLTDPDFYARKDRVTLGGGVALGAGKLTGVVEVNTLLLNEDQRDTTVGLHLRLAV